MISQLEKIKYFAINFTILSTESSVLSVRLTRMKLLVICSLLFALALADERPIYEFPEWWKLRDFEPSQWIQSRFRGGRIIGGSEAAPAQFPYHVGLRLFIQNSVNVGLVVVL